MTPMEKATEAVLNRFLGGSSGLDEMAQAIAKDHAEAAVSTYVAALPEDEKTVEEVAMALAPVAWAQVGGDCDSLAYKNLRKASLRHARAALLALAEKGKS